MFSQKYRPIGLALGFTLLLVLTGCPVSTPTIAPPKITGVTNSPLPWYGNQLFFGGTDFEETMVATFEKDRIEVTAGAFFDSRAFDPRVLTLAPPFDSRWGQLSKTNKYIDVNVSLKTSAGTSNKWVVRYYWTPPPVITNISVKSGPKTGGTSMTITGKGLDFPGYVFFGNAYVPRQFDINGDGTEITLVTPAFRGGQFNGNAPDPKVYVSIRDRNGLLSNPVEFTYDDVVNDSICQYGASAFDCAAISTKDACDLSEKCGWVLRPPNVTDALIPNPPLTGLCLGIEQTVCMATFPSAEILPATVVSNPLPVGQNIAFGPGLNSLSYFWIGHGNQLLNPSLSATLFNAGNMIATAASLAKTNPNTDSLLVQSFGCCTFLNLNEVNQAIIQKLVPEIKENQTVNLVGSTGLNIMSANMPAGYYVSAALQIVVDKNGILGEDEVSVVRNYPTCGFLCQENGSSNWGWKYNGRCPDTDCSTISSALPDCNADQAGLYTSGTCP